MNIYVVVEGRVVEKEVYRTWIPLVNPTLSYAPTIGHVAGNNFTIISGNGIPQYYDVIESALRDVADGGVFHRLVICVDSEELSLEDKRNEIAQFVASTGVTGVDVRVVVQHFCFEAWALGHQRIGSRNPKNPVLASYRKLYNVNRLDPEGLPPLPNEQLNRSQFAEKYLRLTLNDRNKRLTYSKSAPGHVAHPSYFRALKRRYQDTAHIGSFGDFLRAFV